MSPDEVEGRCPCGGTFHARAVDGEDPFVAHSEPTCAKFDALAIDDYLRWVRETLMRGAPKA